MTETQMILKILENNLKLNPNEKRSFLDIMKKLCVKYSSLGLPNVMLQSLLGCETDVTKLGIKIEDSLSEVYSFRYSVPRNRYGSSLL
jgi:hypothetical protein